MVNYKPMKAMPFVGTSLGYPMGWWSRPLAHSVEVGTPTLHWLWMLHQSHVSFSSSSGESTVHLQTASKLLDSPFPVSHSNQPLEGQAVVSLTSDQVSNVNADWMCCWRIRYLPEEPSTAVVCLHVPLQPGRVGGQTRLPISRRILVHPVSPI